MESGKAHHAAKSGAYLRNERGVILIIVLIMLLLLSILGATVLTSSTSDLRIAGNGRNLQEAFFNADGSLEHALVNSTVLSGVAWTGFVYMNAGLPAVVDTATGLPVGATQIAQVNSVYLGEGKAPRGSGYDESTLVNYYDVNVVGSGPNATEVAIDAGVAKFH
jgi:Tfp pilus assembly protein PilX